MATTRIMPLHVGKGRTESRAISDIIDYVANPKKTNNGRLITGYACDSRTADAEFLLANPPCLMHFAGQLIQVIAASAHQGDQLLQLRQIQFDHIPIQCHFPQISTQIFCPVLLHLLMDQLQFLCGHPKQNRNIPLTLCHGYRSGSRFFWAAGLWAGSSCLSLSRTEGRDGCSFSP